MRLKRYYTELADRVVKTAAEAAALSIGQESLHANAFAIDWSNAAGFALGGAALAFLLNVSQLGITGRGNPNAGE